MIDRKVFCRVLLQIVVMGLSHLKEMGSEALKVNFQTTIHRSLYLFVCVFLASCSFLEPQKKTQEYVKETSAQDEKEKIKILLNQGSILLKEKKYNQAIEKISEANLTLPSLEGYYLLGLSYVKMEKLTQAKESFKKGLELNPKHEAILSSLAVTEIALGNEEDALVTYNRLTEHYPKESYYFLKKGIILKVLKRNQEAYSTFKKINAQNFQQKSQLYMHLGEVCYLLKKYSESEEYLTKAKQADPSLKEVDALLTQSKFNSSLEKGITLFENKNFPSAISFFIDALVVKSDSIESLLYLGKSYYNTSQLDKAEGIFKKSIELDNRNREGYIYLSQIYAKKNDFLKLVSNYNLAIQFLPQEVEFYNELGLGYKKIGNNKRALLTFIQAKEVNNKYLPARKNLVETFLEEGQFFEAKREIDELSELAPADQFVTKNRKLLDSKQNSNVLEEKKTVPNNKGKSKKIEEIVHYFDSHFELGQKEKCLSFLKKVWIEEMSLEVRETIGSLYQKLGEDELAAQTFKDILAKNPESHLSYYQLGIISLPVDRIFALRNFEKAIALRKNYTSAYIARGITHYKLGNRERAKEDFYYALSIDPELEMASYNLGMIYYNDNLYNDAEAIFLDLTKKFPNFADPYYHLGYMYYEHKELEKAEKYILISLKLERNPVTIYAYIKILEEIKKAKIFRENLDLQITSLRREIVENYPNSPYAQTLSKVVFSNKENKVVIQSYPLFGSVVTEPIHINQSLIVNYGTSIARIDSLTKSLIWRKDTPIKYEWLKANTRIYGLTKTHLEQIDLETGKVLWRVKLDSILPSRLEIADSILLAGKKGNKEILFSYSFEGELQSNLVLEEGSKWELTKKGNLFLFHNTADGMRWNIFNSKLETQNDGFTLLGSIAGEIILIGSQDNSCYVHKGSYVYKFEPDGSFRRSEKNESTSVGNENLKEMSISENLYLSSQGVLSFRGRMGKESWSEKISSKSNSSVFSVYFKD